MVDEVKYMEVDMSKMIESLLFVIVIVVLILEFQKMKKKEDFHGSGF